MPFAPRRVPRFSRGTSLAVVSAKNGRVRACNIYRGLFMATYLGRFIHKKISLGLLDTQLLGGVSDDDGRLATATEDCESLF